MIFDHAFKGIMAWSSKKIQLLLSSNSNTFAASGKKSGEIESFMHFMQKKHKFIIPGSKALPDALAKAQFPNKNSTRTFTASSKATP